MLRVVPIQSFVKTSQLSPDYISEKQRSIMQRKQEAPLRMKKQIQQLSAQLWKLIFSSVQTIKSGTASLHNFKQLHDLINRYAKGDIPPELISDQTLNKMNKSIQYFTDKAKTIQYTAGALKSFDVVYNALRFEGIPDAVQAPAKQPKTPAVQPAAPAAPAAPRRRTRRGTSPQKTTPAPAQQESVPV